MSSRGQPPIGVLVPGRMWVSSRETSACSRGLRTRRAERAMPELCISPAKVCDFIEAAREVAGLVPPTTGDRTTTGDDSKLTTIEDNPGDSRWSQMREFLAGLNVAEQVDLLA